MIGRVGACIALVALCWPLPAMSQLERINLTTSSMMELDVQMRRAAGHPNELWRYRALMAHHRGNDSAAAGHFGRAAKYADKFSQHALSLMHWHGTGVPRDRVQAYIWSDLAAERGNRRLLAIREKMWASLDAAQQAEVGRRGPDFYARYGDEVAMRRANLEIWSAATEATGSRVGYQSKLSILLGGLPYRPSASQVAAIPAVSDEALYGRDRVDPDRYWPQQNRLLESQVEVGSLQQVDQAPPAAPQP